MTSSNSTSSADPGKPARPAKPSPDFPLTAHPAGYWCKKIKGKLYYFGSRFKADDPVEAAAAAAEALDDYNRQADALHAGKKPRESTEGTTVKDIANAFLNCK